MRTGRARNREANSRWMESKKQNRPQQVWNTETKKWEHREP